MILITAHAWYGDLIGGSFRLASEFAAYLASQGGRVAYVCCDTRGARGTEKGSGPCCRNGPEGAEDKRVLSDLPPHEVQDGVEIYRYPARPAGSLVPLVWYHVVQTRRIVHQLACEHEVAAISGHSPLQFLGACLGVRPAQPLRNYTVHSPFDDELLADSVRRHGMARTGAARVARWIDRWNIGLADCVQTDSKYTLDVLTQKHGGRVQSKGVVAPGWVDVEAFRPAASRAAERKRLGGPWEFDGPLFFTLRRLEARMGLETLVGAAARLRRSGESFRVLIGGGGSLASPLQTMIREQGLAEHVFLLGRVEQDKVPACYAAADCFVLPTRALECFGLIVLEAYAAGTPVIASNVAAIPELVRQAGAEWLFPPGDEGQLAEKMLDFLSGRLRPRREVREIACRYDRNVVLPRWEETLVARF